MRAAGRPADYPEPFRLDSAEQLLRPLAKRAAPRVRSAPIDREQPNAECCGDRVVRVARKARVAATVQIDDRRSGRVADVVDRYRTLSVPRMPRIR